MDSLISLSVVSNSQLLREGLPTLLAAHLALELVGTYPGDFDLDNDLSNPPQHLVLLDCGIGQERALRWTHFWRDRVDPAQVIVLELANDPALIVSCLEAGARGYTLKGASVAEVAHVIQQVAQGLACCSPEVTALLCARLEAFHRVVPAKAPSMRIPLTARELEVLHCIARGMSNKEIGVCLFIEIHTVKHHVHNILEKLRLNHRHEAARFASEQGWLSNLAYPRPNNSH